MLFFSRSRSSFFSSNVTALQLAEIIVPVLDYTLSISIEQFDDIRAGLKPIPVLVRRQLRRIGQPVRTKVIEGERKFIVYEKSLILPANLSFVQIPVGDVESRIPN